MSALVVRNTKYNQLPSTTKTRKLPTTRKVILPILRKEAYSGNILAREPFRKLDDNYKARPSRAVFTVDDEGNQYLFLSFSSKEYEIQILHDRYFSDLHT